MDLRKAIIVMGSVAGVSAVASAMLTGCSGDDTTPLDSGKDVSPDTSTDGGQDAGLDAPDARLDSGPDADPVATFLDQMALAYCARFQNCCNGNDAGPYDYQRCVNNVKIHGIQLSHADLETPETLGRKNLVLDQTAAQACLAGLATVSCPIVTASEWKTLIDACFNAVTGTLNNGGACIKSIECKKGEYCNFGVDGGKTDGGNVVGTCASLLGQNGKCGQLIQYVQYYSSEECAYKGWQTPAQFCNYDLAPDAASYACVPLRANSAACYTDNECSSAMCSELSTNGPCVFNCQCATSRNFLPVCDENKAKDAGPG
jgi:hypothetical protein